MGKLSMCFKYVFCLGEDTSHICVKETLICLMLSNQDPVKVILSADLSVSSHNCLQRFLLPPCGCLIRV